MLSAINLSDNVIGCHVSNIVAILHIIQDIRGIIGKGLLILDFHSKVVDCTQENFQILKKLPYNFIASEKMQVF